MGSGMFCNVCIGCLKKIGRNSYFYFSFGKTLKNV